MLHALLLACSLGLAPASPSSPPPAADPCLSVASFRAGGAKETGVALARAFVAACGRAQTVALAQELIRIPTVSAREDSATGPSFVAMADFLRSWARAHGLGFRVVGNNDAWEVTLGEGRRRLGFVVHADVVPEAETSVRGDALPEGWTHPPFVGTVDGARLFGRGSEDDKGPLAATLVTLAALAGAAVAPDGQILAIIGTGEEQDWDGMERYAGTEPVPDNVVSVDAEFPVVVGEAGFVEWRLAAPVSPPKQRERAVIIDARGGEFLTQVPGEAHMTLAPAKLESAAQLLARVRAAITAEESARTTGGQRFRFSAEPDAAGANVVVHTYGESVHSSVAERGQNALWPLASLASRLKVESNGFGVILELVAKKLDNDPWGEKLGVGYSDPVMGKLLVAPTMLRLEEDQAVLGINMRRPAGMSSVDFSAKLDAALTRLRRDIGKSLVERGSRYVGEARLVDRESPLVATLLDVYRTIAKDPQAQPVTIRGGTYAKLFPGAVSFGPTAPGQPYRGHAADESIGLDELDRLTTMLVEVCVRLAGL